MQSMFCTPKGPCLSKVSAGEVTLDRQIGVSALPGETSVGQRDSQYAWKYFSRVSRSKISIRSFRKRDKPAFCFRFGAIVVCHTATLDLSIIWRVGLRSRASDVWQLSQTIVIFSARWLGLQQSSDISNGMNTGQKRSRNFSKPLSA